VRKRNRKYDQKFSSRKSDNKGVEQRTELHKRFIELADEINDAMPEWIVSKIDEASNIRNKSVRGSRILVLGRAYEKMWMTCANRRR
jgi:UDP-N-acetyl-D-mannosaminuronate dehydrogenase